MTTVTYQKFNDMVEYTWANLPYDICAEMAAIDDKDKLIRYHGTIGRAIRNLFNLWATTWTPVISNGCDVSENHPDRLSMRVIEAVWQKIRNANIASTVTIKPLSRK